MTENSPAPAAEEPSIEEILASIRKIISDEPGADVAEAVAAVDIAQNVNGAAEEEEEILDLSAFQAAPEESVPPIPAEMDIDLSDHHKIDEFDSSLLPPHLQTAMAPIRTEISDTGIASPETLDAAAAAMAKLQRAAEPSYASTTQLWVGARTIEQLVEDLLRPILKTWLDQNLPQLVERLVEKELARMSKRAGD